MWHDNKPFTFDRLITRISEYLLQYKSLIFANCRMFSYLETEHQFPNVQHEYILNTTKATPKLIGKFTGNDLMRDVIDYGRYCHTNYRSTCGNLLLMNAHFIRTKMINNVYEAILNYTHQHSNKQLFTLLQSQDWFRVFHVLRRNASHFDNYGKKLNWQADYPDTLKWGTIEINKGQLGHTVRYDDKEIIDLLNFITGYLQENKAIFQ